jgi:hypothetical protein
MGGWLANNWRPYATEKGVKNNLRTTYIDILWDKRKDEVEAELKKMLNVTELDNSKQEVFKLRTTACKLVFERYNEQEKQEIRTLLAIHKVTGNDERTRRQ